MPRLLGSQWCAGIGSGVVSKGTETGLGTVIAEASGDAHWLDGQVAYQREAGGHAWLEREDGVHLNELGANRFRAGGPVWAAWLAGVGYRDSLGIVERTWNVADVGPDGTRAVILNRETGRGLQLIHLNGTTVTVTDAAPDDQTVQVLDANTAIWTEQGRQVIRSIGLPSLELLTHVGFWLRAVPIGSALWLLYQDERDRLLFHPAGDPMGFVLAQGNTFRPDASPDRVVWATHEGERPADIVVLPVAQFPARTDVRPSVIPPAIPPVEPPKDPIVENNPLPAFIATLLPVWIAAHPVPQIQDGEGDDVFTERMRTWMLPLHEQIEFLAPGQGYGRKRGDPGRPWGKDTIPHVATLGSDWDGHVIVEGEGWDIFTGTSAGHPSFNPNVRSVNLAGQYFETVAPVNHMGLDPGHPGGGGGDTPPVATTAPAALPPSWDAIVAACVKANPGASTGTDTQKRELVRLIAKELACLVDPKVGTKRAAPDRDLSKNAIGYNVTPLVGYVLFTDAGQVIPGAKVQSMAGQVFEAVTPEDVLHLGTAKPPDPPADLAARVAALEKRLTGISTTTGNAIAALKKRIARLEAAKP